MPIFMYYAVASVISAQIGKALILASGYVK